MARSGPAVSALLLTVLSACAASASTAGVSDAAKLAGRVGLRDGDLPGFRVQPNVTVTNGEATLRRCLGVKGRPLAVRLSPPLQGLESGRIAAASSLVTVMPNAAAARAYLDAFGGPRGLRCGVESLHAQSGARPSVRASTRPSPVSGGTASRFVLRGGSLPRGAAEYVGATAFARDQVVVVLQTSAFGHPFPLSLERHAADRVRTRVTHAG